MFCRCPLLPLLPHSEAKSHRPVAPRDGPFCCPGVVRFPPMSGHRPAYSNVPTGQRWAMFGQSSGGVGGFAPFRLVAAPWPMPYKSSHRALAALPLSRTAGGRCWFESRPELFRGTRPCNRARAVARARFLIPGKYLPLARPCDVVALFPSGVRSGANPDIALSNCCHTSPFRAGGLHPYLHRGCGLRLGKRGGHSLVLDLLCLHVNHLGGGRPGWIGKLNP